MISNTEIGVRMTIGFVAVLLLMAVIAVIGIII